MLFSYKYISKIHAYGVKESRPTKYDYLALFLSMGWRITSTEKYINCIDTYNNKILCLNVV